MDEFQSMDLFSWSAAEQGKADGMAAAEANAAPDFIDAAVAAIRAAALARPEVSMNDVWPALEQQGIHTHENRAAGPVMRRCAERGWIVKTERTIRSIRSTRHKGDVRVWKSLIYRHEESF